MQINERILILRKDLNKTQKEISKLLNTSQSYYAQYENNKRKLPIEHLITLCKYYNISADYILGLIDEKRPLL